MDNVELGKKVKELRKSRHLLQQDLADLLEISRSQISNLEKGRRGLNLRQLEKLCTLFKIDIGYFGIEKTGEETISLLERAKHLFENDDVPTEKKDELYLQLMEVYLKSKKE